MFHERRKINQEEHWATSCLLVLSGLLLSSFSSSYALDEMTWSTIPSNSTGIRPLTLTLTDSIELARQNFPAIRAAELRRQAANAGISKARTAYLPRGSMLVQETRATSNNITGPIFPNLTIPNISGGVKGNKNEMPGGWGSAAGALVSWEPFDFGLRKAKVDVARSLTTQAQEQLAVTELDAMSNAAQTFLAAVAAKQVVRAAQARLDRMKIFAATVRVLVQKELRPGTDEFLAQAEEAKAKDGVIEAEQNLDLAMAALGRAVATVSNSITIDAGLLVEKEPETTLTFQDPFAHPAALAQQAAVAAAGARRRVIERAYYPQFNLLGASWARGSSYNTDVSIDNSKGYYPQKFNYALGIGVFFPFLDIFELRADHKIALKLEQEEKARYDLTLLNLQTQDAQARALIKGAIRIAENAPVKVKASYEAARSAQIRYKCGLATVNDVAQNDDLLTESQVDYATAQVRVWRALLAAAVAHGDLKPFVDQVTKVGTLRR